jgi:hypothetical protein
MNDITDRQLRAELENYSVYEHLVSEKMNPKFLCLAKSYNQQKGLDSIMDSNGEAFTSDTMRKEFITNYYANIYKEVPGRVNSYPGCVADFLGEDITNNPEVAGKKVPENLRIEFESPITLNELDLALDKMRNGSAGGPDGLQ